MKKKSLLPTIAFAFLLSVSVTSAQTAPTGDNTAYPPPQNQMQPPPPPPPSSSVDQMRSGMPSGTGMPYQNYQPKYNQQYGGNDSGSFQPPRPPQNQPPVNQTNGNSYTPRGDTGERGDMMKQMFNQKNQNQQGQNNFGNSGQQNKDQSGQSGKSENSQEKMKQVMEEQQKHQQDMQAEQEKKQQVMVAQQGARMAKALQKTLTALKQKVTKLQQKGIGQSSECADTITNGNDLVTKLQAVTDPDDLSDLQDNSGLMQSINQCRMNMDRLSNTPQMLKNAGQTIARLKKRGTDVSALQSAYTELQTQFATIKAGGYSGDDLDNFFSSLEDFGSDMQNAMQGQQQKPDGAPQAPPAQMKTPTPATGDQGGNVYGAFLNFFRPNR